MTKKIDGRRNNGGKRINAGRKLKYGEPTIKKTFAIPKSKFNEFVKHCKTKLKEYEI